MNSLIFYLGTFYILVGTIFLTVPIIYLELGKPKDLIKAFLNLLIGLILIIKNKTLDESFFVIFLFLTVLVLSLIHISEPTRPSNFFNFGSNNKNTTQKKWVRNDKNDNIKVWNKNWLFETSQKNYRSIKKEYNKLDLFKQFSWSPIFSFQSYEISK